MNKGECWRDGDEILRNRNEEKAKLEGFLHDIKNVAKTFIPEEQKAFFLKWNRLKVSINVVFNAFDHLECVWDEVKEEARKNAKMLSEHTQPLKKEYVDAGIQTEAVEEEEPVLDWRSLVDEASDYNKDEDEEEEETGRKISVQSWSPAGESRSATPELPINRKLPDVIEEGAKKVSPKKITPVLEEVMDSQEDSQSLPDLEELNQEVDNAPKSSAVVPDLYVLPKSQMNEEEEKTPTMTRGRKSAGLSATLPVSSEAPVKRKRGRPRKSDAPLLAESKPKKELAIKGKTKLEKYKRKSAPGRTFPEKTEVKRSRRLEDTIQHIRRTRDNSFETSVPAISKRSGEPAGVNGGRPTPPPTPPVPSGNSGAETHGSYEMEIFNQVLQDKKMLL